MLKSGRTAWASAVALLAVCATTAATAGGAPLAGASAGQAAGGRASDVTLTLVDIETSAGPAGAIKDLIKAYKAKAPSVTINQKVVAYANYRTSIKLQASSSNAPDIIEGDVGPGGVIASLGQANLLAPLDTYAAKYGWRKTYGPLTRELQLPLKGKGVGTGPIWGIPGFGEMLGVFYNKTLLAKVGDPVPATFAQFEKTLADAKAAGITPITIGGLDQWPWSHFYDLLADHFASTQAQNQLVRGPAGRVDRQSRHDQGRREAAGLEQGRLLRVGRERRQRQRRRRALLARQVPLQVFQAGDISSHHSGMGLGLFISHRIVTSHGGRMWFESSEHEGSTFYFSLPLA